MELKYELNLLETNNDFKELKQFYANKSSLDIIGVSRKEYVHSNFLYWILDDKEHHNLNTTALKYLLEMYLFSNTEKIKEIFNIDYKEYLKDRDFEIKDLKIEREKDTKKYGRLDLFLNFNIQKQNYKKEINMIIENKIYSLENENNGEMQTNNYYKWLENEKKNTVPIYIYLTPNDSEPVNDNFKRIGFESYIRNIVERCYFEVDNLYSKNIIEDYLRSLTFNDGTETLAITRKEMILTANIWKQFSRTIEEIIETENKDKLKNYKKNNIQSYNTLINILNIIVADKIGDVEENMKNKIKDSIGKNEYEYKGIVYKKGLRNKALKDLALAIVTNYSKGKNFETIENTLKGVCTTAKGMPLLIENEALKINKESDKEWDGWYFDTKDKLITIGSKNYALYAWWNNTEIKELIEITGEDAR